MIELKPISEMSDEELAANHGSASAKEQERRTAARARLAPVAGPTERDMVRSQPGASRMKRAWDDQYDRFHRTQHVARLTPSQQRDLAEARREAQRRESRMVDQARDAQALDMQRSLAARQDAGGGRIVRDGFDDREQSISAHRSGFGG